MLLFVNSTSCYPISATCHSIVYHDRIIIPSFQVFHKKVFTPNLGPVDSNSGTSPVFLSTVYSLWNCEFYFEVIDERSSYI